MVSVELVDIRQKHNRPIIIGYNSSPILYRTTWFATELSVWAYSMALFQM